MHYLRNFYLVLLFFLILAGAFYRLKGISTNHSFWSDEAYISSFAREILSGKNIFRNLQNLQYQQLQVLITTASFKSIGTTEFGARFPSVLFGTIGILFAYLLTSSLSNREGGLLTAFLYSFLQINLANSTQAKPYALLQTLSLIVIYLIVRLNIHRRSRLLHLAILLVCTISSLVHSLGILIWMPYIIYSAITYKKDIGNMFTSKRIIFMVMGILAAIFVFQVPHLIGSFFSRGMTLFPYNQITYLRELLWRNYAFITLPAIVGCLICLSRHRLLTYSVMSFVFVYLYLWNFHSYSHNIRYLLPVFGILIVYFGVFWARVGETLLDKKSGILCLLIAILLYAGGYKLVRKPATYYSPNADLYGDVQNADYKSMYEKIKQKYPHTDSYVIYNDGPDTQLWYLNGRAPDGTFLKSYVANIPYGQTKNHDATGKPIYTSVSQFESVIKNNPKGMIIVEDWESYLPDEIKIYAKQHLKFEFRIEGLPQAQGDNWPLEVYTWGL